MILRASMFILNLLILMPAIVSQGSTEAFVAGEVAEVTDVVARLTGHCPRSFTAFARELRAAP